TELELEGLATVRRIGRELFAGSSALSQWIRLASMLVAVGGEPLGVVAPDAIDLRIRGVKVPKHVIERTVLHHHDEHSSDIIAPGAFSVGASQNFTIMIGARSHRLSRVRRFSSRPCIQPRTPTMTFNGDSSSRVVSSSSAPGTFVLKS
ncbi:MAG: hypothetical protein QOD94_2989, partial [Alphaproteobacteria bacterium]|nr:hypothetical protein [Alphaproteobacteria bacterium]